MQIDNQTTPTGALGGQTPEAPSTDLDRDAFMRLLVTQIRNQDPMDPMDTQQMMSQLTELTSVEQLIGIEDRLGGLQVASASIANAQVADFVGKEVTADTSHLRLEDTGAVPGALTLEGRAEQVTVTIRDAEGRVVRTMELGPQFAGPVGYEWGGNDDGGQRVDPGRYRVEVEAVDADGTPVAVDTRLRGRVTGVSYEDGYPELILDGEHRVAVGDVREVRDPMGASPTTSSSPAPSHHAVASYEASRHLETPSGESDR